MKRVLVTPLDWGLGHATRCIPIIRALIEHNCEVFIAGWGASLELLHEEFPDIKIIQLEGYNPEYPSSGSMVWKMAKQLPKFIRTIAFEHQAIEKIIASKKISLVISDNRYGAWSSQIPSVLITHQSNILMPKRFGWLQGLVRFFNHRQMKKFSVCWIPDLPHGKNLAGDLISFGDTKDLKVEYIGALSRFRKQEPVNKNFQYKILVILSGPEPQRTILENLIIPQLRQSTLSYFVVRGVFDADEIEDPNVTDFLTTKNLQEKIETSEIIISRSGYSSIMDMAALEKKAIFIPTPGQTEQEYLARILMQKQIAYSMKQKEFNLIKAIEESASYTGFINFETGDAFLKNAIKKILSDTRDHAPVLY
jgi:uncharacterized protein (TIGR00661 family)